MMNLTYLRLPRGIGKGRVLIAYCPEVDTQHMSKYYLRMGIIWEIIFMTTFAELGFDCLALFNF